MAEESMMSTAESGMEPPPGAPAGAPAEMITKKLANYWCLIGSIPMILFLLVAIPTIFYVKKFSEYVNAEYCDTKSCKDLADTILKMGDAKDACKSFSAHVCKAKANYAFETLKKMAKDIEAIQVAAEPGLGTASVAKQFVAACLQSPGITEDPDTGLPDFGKKFDDQGLTDPALLSGLMSVHGVDGLVRAVAITGNTSGNQEVKTILELSAPIEELFAYEILSMGGKTLKDAATQLVPDINDKLVNLERFVRNYSQYMISTTMTAAQNMVKLTTVGELKNTFGTQTWNWQQYFKPFEDLHLDYLEDDSMVRMAHPNYLLGLDGYLETWVRTDANIYVILDVYLQVMANINLKGHLSLKNYADSGKPAACVMLAARLFPAAMDHMIYYQRLKQFGAAKGINPGGGNDLAMKKFLRSQVQGMLDSFTFSYSLSQSVTEENRVHVYRKVSRLMVSPGFLNDSEGKLTDTAIKELALNVPPGDDLALTDALEMSRQTFPALYWKKDSSYHMFRNQFSPLYASYTPSLNHLYVPMGVFTKPVFRNSQKNRIFTAAAGYLVMSGFMKALTMSGHSVVHDVKHRAVVPKEHHSKPTVGPT
ncbi:uncharacterized protein [Dermacentor albipictus]|uniref:uncharacterized protein isoform X2 n=1 Tax=Dermacentor albipictus TaxID=60249 RepID=UPI0038FC21F9